MHSLRISETTVDLPVRLKRYTTMKKYLKMRPHLRQIPCAAAIEYIADHSQKPGRHSRDIGHIGMGGSIHQSRELILPVWQKSGLTVGYPHHIGERINTSYESGTEISDAYPRSLKTKGIGERTSENERLTWKDTALRHLSQIMGHSISPSPVMVAVETGACDRYELRLSSGRTRRLSVVATASRP